MPDNNFCKLPFYRVQIQQKGDVYICCPSQQKIILGNIFKTPFEHIWNSPITQDLRQSCINKEYKYCRVDICKPEYNKELPFFCNDEDVKPIAPLPKWVDLCYDTQCNIRCITCRDKIKVNTKEEIEILNNNIESCILPILKEAKVVYLNGGGEVFASPHSRLLIKKIAEKYPDIQFDIHTNGILCDKQNLEELGIADKLYRVSVSLQGYHKKTVEKIMIGTDYDRVIKNLYYLSTLKKRGKLKELSMYFVVNSINYKEMKDYVKLAKKLGAEVAFWEYRRWGAKIDKDYNKLAVFEPWNIKYNDFAQIIQDPIFKDPQIYLNNKLLNCKPIPLKVYMKYRLYDILKFLHINISYD